MFGYLDIQREKLKDGERGLWHSFMCGECLATKRLLGNVPRMFVSNDITFFNVLLHSICGVSLGTNKVNCLSHPIVKQTVISPSELTDKVSVASVILTYWNLYDDVVDGCNIVKRAAFRLVKKSYLKAKEIMPALDESVKNNYQNLRLQEQNQANGPDAVSHSFATLAMEFGREILGDKATEHSDVLFYNVGKWIYLIDALDDLPDDVKKHNYNPFAACYGLTDANQLAEHLDEVKFLMYSVLNRIAQSFNDLNLTMYVCLLKNVIYHSIRNQTEQILQRYQTEKK